MIPESPEHFNHLGTYSQPEPLVLRAEPPHTRHHNRWLFICLRLL